MFKLFAIILFFIPTVTLGNDNSQAPFGLDWDILIKALGALVGAVVAYTQVKSTHPISRSAMKADLEILNLLTKSDPNYQLIKSNIEPRIQKLYGAQPKYTDWFTVAFGAICAAGFAYWTFYLVRDEFTWWSLLTGYFALAGMGWIMMGFRGGFKQTLKERSESRKIRQEISKSQSGAKDTAVA